MNFGWCYYTRGATFGIGKNHYIKKTEWKSICGHWEVRPEEQKFILFVPFEKIRIRRRCGACIKRLDAWNISYKVAEA